MATRHRRLWLWLGGLRVGGWEVEGVVRGVRERRGARRTARCGATPNQSTHCCSTLHTHTLSTALAETEAYGERRGDTDTWLCLPLVSGERAALLTWLRRSSLRLCLTVYLLTICAARFCAQVWEDG